jgi:transcriptional regulator with XRE-family HTH domain
MRRRTTVKLRFRSMPKSQNIVGPVIRKLRNEQELTQEMLAARCEVLGMELSRATLSKIEARLRCVTDAELVVIADALKVSVQDLFSPATKKPK